MSGWFGGSGGGGGNRSWQTSLDSLKNQVSNSLREVVDAVAVDPSTLNPEDDATDDTFGSNEVYRVQSSPNLLHENNKDHDDQLKVVINDIAKLQAVIDSQAKHIQKLTKDNQQLTTEKENSNYYSLFK